ncbi:hypothetical protein NDU88_012650 [Pleurodeles waltl]|uniref:Uncharacterized protein n=1 Tax=Pleurodeles waltl TaxID=8319 RepID=A0AAV7R6J7_PLEWA|nr:hypothetical protein NDU88_012650 [Pleurodeles waltl]
MGRPCRSLLGEAAGHGRGRTGAAVPRGDSTAVSGNPFKPRSTLGPGLPPQGSRRQPRIQSSRDPNREVAARGMPEILGRVDLPGH